MNPTRFGKYILLEKIGTGGMAELFLAKQEGMKGFEKILAIKRILPHLTQDNEFVSMFINEAKLAALLAHQNIVQIYDLGSAVPAGQVDPSYYIAMEYIMGRDLRSILTTTRNRSATFPIDHALSIMSKVCCGLDYAHRKKDTQGRDLNIVHRDISPQNILISYEGDVKIVDFGIAKAASQGSETRTGILKGKLAYMSPEQAWGKPVDRRTDIFAMGIVLYEILTGERLFKGENEISTLEKVREAKVEPPSSFNPHVGAELNEILLKALAKEPKDRYQTASEMALVLEGVISSKGYSFSSLSLSNTMRHLFHEEVEEETKRIQSVATNAIPVRSVQAPDKKNDERSTLIRPRPSPTVPQTHGRESRGSSTGRITPAHLARPKQKSHPILKGFLFSIALTLLTGYLAFLYQPQLLQTATPYLPWLPKALENFNHLQQTLLAKETLPPQPGPTTSEISPATPPRLEKRLTALQQVSLPTTEPSTQSPMDPPPSSNPLPLLDQEFANISTDPQPPGSHPTRLMPGRFPHRKERVMDLFKEVKQAYNDGKMDEVEKKLRQIIDIAPRTPMAYHLLGTLYLNRKDHETALRIFSEAASNFPEDPSLHYDLGFLYYQRDLHSLARDEFSKAISLAPDAPPAERARQILQEIGGA